MQKQLCMIANVCKLIYMYYNICIKGREQKGFFVELRTGQDQFILQLHQQVEKP